MRTNRVEESMRLAALLMLPLCAACSADRLTNGDPADATHEIVQVDGPLTLTVRDFTSPGGILWALPSVTPGVGSITVGATQYGSLCRFDVAGRVENNGNDVALHILFFERLTLCTAEIRALSYAATWPEIAGTYNL